MKSNINIILFIAIFLNLFSPDLSKALTVKQEKELGKKVLHQIESSSFIIKDQFMENYINSLGQKIVKISDNKLFDFHFFVLKKKSYNAFALPGGNIFIHTGLITAMDNESELAGILGHEIGHVNCRHISDQINKSKTITLGTLAGLAAGIILGLNGADPNAVTGLIAGTQATSQSLMLSYSRKHETEADNMALKYLVKAEYSPEGLLKILEKIRAKDTITPEQMPEYLRTHPGTEHRISSIKQFMESHGNKFKNNYDKSLFSPFNKFKIKTIALYETKDVAKANLEKIEQDKAPLAYYGLGLMYMKNQDYQKSEKYFLKSFKFNALDPELIYYYSKLLFLMGKYKESEKYMKSIRSNPVINDEATLFIAKNQIKLGKYENAKKNLLELLSEKISRNEIFYLLGITFEKTGHKGDAHFYLGKYYKTKRDRETAIFHFKKALTMLTGKKKKEAEKEIANLKGINNKKTEDKKEKNKKIKYVTI